MKIIGIGWHKTGTTTLGHCLRELGFRHRSWNPQDFELWLEGNIYELLSVGRKYESFDDFPWPFIYKEMDKTFPKSKFILTTRIDAETWFRSICMHAERNGPLRYRELIYGKPMPSGHKAAYISAYNHHNETVRDFFSDRPGDLLEVCWEEGDGWKELATFLDREIPSKPLPHANKSRARGKAARA